MRQLTDIRAGDEGFVAVTRQDHAANGFILACILESGLQVFPGGMTQRVHHLRAIERYVSDGAFLFVQDIGERYFGRSAHWISPVFTICFLPPLLTRMPLIPLP